MSTFLTADSHFGHFNVIRLCNRPFTTVEEMDERLIANWNAAVKPEDTVYHLGDFSFKNTTTRAHAYRKRLNGNVILIRGNHDPKRIFTQGVFGSVHDILTVQISGVTIVLCHYSMRSWPGSHRNVWHLFGHSHGKLPPYGKSFDIGVDCHNYKPLSLDEVVEKMRALPDNRGLVADEPAPQEK